jgi:hypothetical protein
MCRPKLTRAAAAAKILRLGCGRGNQPDDNQSFVTQPHDLVQNWVRYLNMCAASLPVLL